MKLIILGLGNTILTDDGVGIYIVRKIKEELNSNTDTCFQEASVGGFGFIDLLSGFDKAVIIDAIHTEKGVPGEFYELDINDLRPSARLSSLHQVDFATACEMAKKINVSFPKEIKIYVMEVEDEFSFSEKTTRKVEQAMPKMVKEVIKELKKLGWING